MGTKGSHELGGVRELLASGVTDGAKPCPGTLLGKKWVGDGSGLDPFAEPVWNKRWVGVSCQLGLGLD